ncbi:hypothetical protein [Lentzea kentuckyensis]|uniref:hypothetical protein n=1 Tax=Lentzea kentuckyensis TaxID=360086 RepID=UPI0013021B46|nr:hypothetical protein [Lentzea kentuckyensis]
MTSTRERSRFSCRSASLAAAETAFAGGGALSSYRTRSWPVRTTSALSNRFTTPVTFRRERSSRWARSVIAMPDRRRRTAVATSCTHSRSSVRAVRNRCRPWSSGRWKITSAGSPSRPARPISW